MKKPKLSKVATQQLIKTEEKCMNTCSLLTLCAVISAVIVFVTPGGIADFDGALAFNLILLPVTLSLFFVSISYLLEYKNVCKYHMVEMREKVLNAFKVSMAASALVPLAFLMSSYVV